MKWDEAISILKMPEKQAAKIILELAEKADKYDQLHDTVSPTTPSGMTPTYLKPNKGKRKKKPGQKKGHPGTSRKTPQTVDYTETHTLETCPNCNTRVNNPVRSYKRYIEEIPPAEPEVTEHTIYGYWCRSCQKTVYSGVSDAMPKARIGLRVTVYTAWLHYFVGISVSNVVKILLESNRFEISTGGLTQAWKRLAELLTPHYDTIGKKIKKSGILHADETGWRLNGKTHWLWCFSTKTLCYYVISKSRGSPVIKRVLGKIFNGILICDFFGAYNKIEALAKQRCFYHLATELVKTDKRNCSDEWNFFRKKLSRLMNDAIRFSHIADQVAAETYSRRLDRLYLRLDQLIELSAPDGDVKRLQKRLRRHRDELFTFLECENVSPYNNHAEQQIRKPVIMRKISQQNRSKDGAKTQAVLMSLFKTYDLQGLNPMETVISVAKASIAGSSTIADMVNEAA